MADPIGKHFKLGDAWELIVVQDNILYLGCNHGDERYVVEIGSLTMPHVDILEEGINYIRTAGEHSSKLN